MSNLLLSTIFLPIVGALTVGLLAPRGKEAVRQSALITSLMTLGLAAYLISQYWVEGNFKDGVYPGEYALSEVSWLGDAASIHFAFGLDGLSVWMFGLSALLTFTAVLVSWNAVTDRPAGFYALLLLLEAGMLGVFSARDLILFYIFFEFTLIPLYFLIGIWGHEQRRYAANKFFLFTFAGSVFALLGLIGMVLWVYHATPNNELTFSIPRLHVLLGEYPIPMDAEHGYLQLLIFGALILGFAIKVPLVPFHTWLPLAHVQAPTGGSIDLAGILLKLGTYGILRFCLPMLPDATALAMPYLLWAAVIGIVYGALVALVQSDMKKLIAYSSVSHMGFVILGFFALNRLGLEGGILQMINHGLSTGGLFALVGMVYERYHTREISELGGIAKRMPILATMFVLFTMASIGLPGLNGFWGEFMILLGTFQRAFVDAPGPLGPQLMVIAVLAVSGVVLGAWYMLWMVQRVFFGPLKEPDPAAMAHHGDDEDAAEHHAEHSSHGAAHGHSAHGEIKDMNAREILAIAPLLVFIVWIGLYPKLFLEPISPAAQQILERTEGPLNAFYGGQGNGGAKPQAATGEEPMTKDKGQGTTDK